jgi:hypothetical protein
MVDTLGTLAVLQSPSEGQNWKVIPNLYERDGCLFTCAPSCTGLLFEHVYTVPLSLISMIFFGSILEVLLYVEGAPGCQMISADEIYLFKLWDTLRELQEHWVLHDQLNDWIANTSLPGGKSLCCSHQLH